MLTDSGLITKVAKRRLKVKKFIKPIIPYNRDKRCKYACARKSFVKSTHGIL